MKTLSVQYKRIISAPWYKRPRKDLEIMPEVNEEIVRLFFEQNGFFVRTNIKFTVHKGGSSGDSDIDLFVINPKGSQEAPFSDLPFILSINDLSHLEAAIIEVKGWHENTFTPSLIRGSTNKIKFHQGAIEKAKEILGHEKLKKVLVLSRLSPNSPWREKAISELKRIRIDHVLEFSTIINDIYDELLENKNYSSEVLQAVRLLKKYVI